MKKEGNCLSRRRVLPSFFMHLADFVGLRVPAPETEPQKRILLTRPLMKKSTKNRKNLLTTQISYAIPSLTVAEIKNRCIPCVYWGTAIFVVVMKYSNLFFSFAFFLDRSHFAFGYELIISSEAAGFMKIICNGFTLI